MLFEIQVSSCEETGGRYYHDKSEFVRAEYTLQRRQVWYKQSIELESKEKVTNRLLFSDEKSLSTFNS